MTEPGALTVAFLRSHPAEAARVLESAPLTDASALLLAVPGRVGARVMGEMHPRIAASLTLRLPTERAAGLLGKLELRQCTSLLRHLTDVDRERLLSVLPTPMAVSARILLGFPVDSVGASADPDLVALPGTTSVGEALERIRSAPHHVDRIYVNDAQHRVAGWLCLDELLRGGAALPLASLQRALPGRLSALAPIGGASAHPAWAATSVMPVVTLDDRIVGVLTRDALQRALHRAGVGTGGPGTGDSVVGLLAGGYWQSVSGLVAIVLELLPRVRGVADER